MCTPAINSIAGKHHPLSLDNWIVLIKICSKQDSGRTSPAIESIAGVHIVYFYGYRDVFSRYRIYHFKDFTCILPLSIDSGKTHKKSPAHSLVFRGFFWKMYLAGFQDWLYHKVHIYLENHSVYPLVQIGTPHPLSRKQVWGSPIGRQEKKFSILSTLWAV